MREVRQGQFYKHFKNRLYQIMAVAEHSETGEQMVVYQALYGDYRIYVRPYEMFVSEVDHEKYPQATQKYRFELVEPNEEKKETQDASVLKLKAEQKETRNASVLKQETEQKETQNASDLKSEAEKKETRNTAVPNPVQNRSETQNMSVLEAEQKKPEEKPDREAAGQQEPSVEDGGVNPLLLEFLDADTLEDKLHILIFGRNQMDDNLLNSIAISLDLVVEEKSTEEKYDEILNCLSMMERFECNRLR